MTISTRSAAPVRPRKLMRDAQRELASGEPSNAIAITAIRRGSLEGVAAGRDRDCAGRTAQQSFADRAEQHVTDRPVVRGAHHDQVRWSSDRRVCNPRAGELEASKRRSTLASPAMPGELAGRLLQG